MPPRTIAAPTLEIRAALVPESYDREAQTIDAVLSQGARVLRAPFFDDPFLEELEMSVEAVRLDRLNSSGSVTTDHQTRSVRGGHHVGTVVQGSARLEPAPGSPQGMQLRSTLQLSRRDDEFMRGLRTDIADGVIRNLSIEYRVHAFRDVTGPDDKFQVLRAIDWEPFGASFVSQPADPAGSVRQADDGATCTIEGQEEPMPKKDATGNSGGTPNPPTPNTPPADGSRASDSGSSQGTPPVEPPAPNPEGERGAAPTPSTPAPTPAPTSTPTGMSQAEFDRAVAHAAATAVKADRERGSTIRSLCRTAGLDDEFAGELVRDAAVTVDVARARIFDRMAQNQESGTQTPISGRIAIGREEADKHTRGMSEALLCKQGLLEHSALSESGRNYRSATLREMAQRCLEFRGEATFGMNVESMIERALSISWRGDLTARDAQGHHSTSDFGSMLGDVANKAMRKRYDLSPRTFLPWARRRDFNDYKVNKRIQLSEWPALTPISEGGEIDVITFGDTQETWVGRRYGNRFALTIEAIVNDDLGGFDRLATSAGEAAAQLQSDIVYALLTDNVVLSDGNAVFDAAHNNIGTEPLALAGLTEMMTTMMTQLGQASQHLNIMPKHLRVPAALLTVARQLATQLTPNQSTDANPFVGQFESIMGEPRLDLDDAATWYAFADPGQIDTVEYGFLSGTDGPRLDQRIGFEIDGIEWKVTLPFGAGVTEHRGMFRSDGTA